MNNQNEKDEVWKKLSTPPPVVHWVSPGVTVRDVDVSSMYPAMIQNATPGVEPVRTPLYAATVGACGVLTDEISSEEFVKYKTAMVELLEQMEKRAMWEKLGDD